MSAEFAPTLRPCPPQARGPYGWLVTSSGLSEPLPVLRSAPTPSLGRFNTLVRSVMENDATVGLATAIIWPRALFAPGAMADYHAFLTTVG